MTEKTVGSRSIKKAPLSSLREEMRPLSSAVKKLSGTHVKVCQEVENLDPGQIEVKIIIQVQI